MSTVNYSFLPKEVDFLIDAIDFRIHDYENKLGNPATTDDERSDIQNDLALIRIILKYLKDPENPENKAKL
jgi:hypothetical protein